MSAIAHAHSPVRTQSRYLAWRSLIRTARQPIMIVPGLVFPLFLLAINASGLDAATEIPGFPTGSYLTFALAFPFVQGAIFATNTAGTNLAEDIGTGFFNRLSLTPMRGSALLAGQLAGVLLIAVVQAITYLVVGLAVGADFEAGWAGIPVLLALSFAVSAAFGAFGLFVGLRTGSGEAVQGLFPLMFVLLFLSSAALPRDLIAHDWFQTAATINPVSYVIEAVRSLFITGWDGEALALGFIVSIAFFAVSMVAATFAMRTRMERT
jgi:ABC-2 type transport system permease protein